MANSMIPYSFIPGTKAKASEVNANFVSLADTIDKNKESAANDIEKVNETLKTKADKTELIQDFNVTEADTDLNNYKTVGTYVFSELYTPANIPNGKAGMLIVHGNEEYLVKQIWICSEEGGEIFTRNFTEGSWQDWNQLPGYTKKINPGYIKFPSGLIIQWGAFAQKSVTYPIAFTTLACPVFAKNGCGTGFEKSDTGFNAETLTGFGIESAGLFYNMNWIAIGY